MPDQQDTADFLTLMDDRHADGLFQNHPGDLHFKIRQQSRFRSLPMGEQLALLVHHLCVGHFFGGRDQRQRLSGGDLIVEHHRGFHGVIDRTGDQMQVVIGINPQGQNPQQGQRNTGHGHAHQGDDQMPTADNRP